MRWEVYIRRYKMEKWYFAHMTDMQPQFSESYCFKPVCKENRENIFVDYGILFIKASGLQEFVTC
ncbi:MAG: hypothetical protein NC902_08025 [Candidatus Omnitrophica bacterium]|nr:hypothetical protein [Candidatus Omnitrophota bacterium]